MRERQNIREDGGGVEEVKEVEEVEEDKDQDACFN